MNLLLSDVLLKQAKGLAGRSATRRWFLSQDDVKAAITNSRHYGEDGTDPKLASALLFYQTADQQTWLVRTPKRVYCVLDELADTTPHINWSLELSAFSGESPVTIREAEPQNSYFGHVVFAPRPEIWFYSKKFFASGDPARMFADFIRG